MIYDWTDSIFQWKGWHVFKWITGIVICAGMLYLVWNYSTNKDFEKDIMEKFHVNSFEMSACPHNYHNGIPS